jgi:hypothetical protein
MCLFIAKNVSEDMTTSDTDVSHYVDSVFNVRWK